ncbi:hypothetical protein [Mycobacterium sp. OTB74]|uniref:hypothetical protein n=1 Tax=Mycobacterium sp. OTB74 TaxID=1853452 RepID=UPI0024746953|nr:hypothetical protein [Mycobacterium sp. OTB74]MDH6245534.1 hypothetical protein [Mycobacterium sp. OTB74]
MVTVILNFWLLWPRPDLRLVHSVEAVEDIKRVTRWNEGNFTGLDWMPLAWVRLTNYGDGNAHDVKLTGERCRHGYGSGIPVCFLMPASRHRPQIRRGPTPSPP